MPGDSEKKSVDSDHSFEQLLAAVGTLSSKIHKGVKWAIDGSMSLALQGITDLKPGDIYILTDETGAYTIEKAFSDRIVRKVQFGKTEKYESHFGRFRLD